MWSLAYWSTDQVGLPWHLRPLLKPPQLSRQQWILKVFLVWQFSNIVIWLKCIYIPKRLSFPPNTGYWLKDPSRIQEPTGVPYGVDYRTERYRLEDLLKKKSPWKRSPYCCIHIMTLHDIMLPFFLVILSTTEPIHVNINKPLSRPYVVWRRKKYHQHKYTQELPISGWCRWL